MRPLLAAALVGLATYGAYALLVRPETAALMQSLSAGASTEASGTAPSSSDDLGVTPAGTKAAGGVERAPLRPDLGAVNTVVGSTLYTVSGDTEQDILNALRIAGPKSAGGVFFGLTVTELEYRYFKVEQHGACRIEDVVVDLKVDITLPDWSPGRDATSELRSAWARFSTALRSHENGHRDLAIEGAEGVRSELEGMRVRDCATADAEAQQAAERIRVETEAAHRDFDHQTGHGRTQGAVWPQP